MPWSDLPFEILVSIFAYASYPLRTPYLALNPSTNWLLKAAHTCQSFREPALTVFYEDPPIVNLNEPHNLLALLKKDAFPSGIQYPSKIKRLELDAITHLSYSTHGSGHLSLLDLVTHMPLLEEIIIKDPTDRPPFRRIPRGKWWTYPPQFFDVLSKFGRKMRTWHWNALMLEQQTTFLPETEKWMSGIHQQSCNHFLENLSLSHFYLDTIGSKRSRTQEEHLEAKDPIEALGRVLSPLQGLTNLSLLSCEAKDWRAVLEALPNNLNQLTISNSQMLTSSDVQAFLESHGSQLTDLTLDHNQSLDLRFLTGLKTSCPRLERLHMNLTFYNSVASYKDDLPLFDALLTAQDVPTWPCSLQSLELFQLRQWESDAAQTFFNSLLDLSDDLPYLRTIVIKAILSIGWRDRAGFRHRTIDQLRKVFLCNSPPPNPALASMKAFRMAKVRSKRDEPTPASAFERAGDRGLSEDNIADRSGTKHSDHKTRRSQRITTHEKTRHTGDFPDDADADEDDVAELTNVQGRCSTVDVSIDNLRPTEIQFREEDFMDSEVSGDEDWTGDGDDVEEAGTRRGGYAW